MSDNELLEIFKEEAEGYLQVLNAGLLKLELADAEEAQALHKEMNRIAHSLKGAARAVGLGMIETVGHYMEEIFHATLYEGLTLTPHMADSIYDGLDLIERRMADEPTDDQIIAKVLADLEAIVTAFQLPAATAGNGQVDPKFESTEMPAVPDDIEATDKRLRTDSTEAPVITDEMLHERASSGVEVPAPDEAPDDLLHIFWGEVSDYLTILNDSLLQIEMAQGGDKDELLQEMNRVAHSMKGAARAVGFGVIETVSHYLEEIFQICLTQGLQLTPRIADVLYDGLDLIQHIVNGAPREEQRAGKVLLDMQRLIAKLSGLDEAEAAIFDEPLAPDAPVPPANETPTVPIPPALMTTTVEMGSASTTVLLRPPEETLRVAVNKLDQLMADSSELLVARMQGEARQRRVDELRRKHARWQREWRGVRAAYIRLVRRLQEQNAAISVEMSTLFKFLEVNQRYLTEANRELAQLGQTLAQDNMQLATLADQLQDNVSELRMMPFETIIGGFQRMARDMARDLGKQVHLEIGGAGVEIDKTVLDALKDPLMHLLRNAIDHGLESPEQREALGKAATGHVQLIVEQRGGEIAIEVHDDGRGINLQRIRRKAVERQILTVQEAQNLSDDEAQMLVFHSGFSTSDSVTALSGRGLGLDIVRNRVESLRGRVHVASTAGQGTTITLSMPVSLTRIRVITLRVGDEDYAIPSVMVERMESAARNEIFTAEGQEMINIGGRPTPLVSLGSILEVPAIAERADYLQLLTLQTADRAVAFEVDGLYSEMELVLKPLGRELLNAPFVAGAALLGSGDVVIVLDANDLVRKATGATYLARQRPIVRAPKAQSRRIRVLVVDDSITTRTLEKNILEAVGFEVSVAIDGVEAWSQIAELEPDVVVSDVEMPNMNGFELTRRIKNAEHLRDLPVILLTSLSKPQQREEGLRAGADAYLVKSRFDQGELLEVIQSVL